MNDRDRGILAGAQPFETERAVIVRDDVIDRALRGRRVDDRRRVVREIDALETAAEPRTLRDGLVPRDVRDARMPRDRVWPTRRELVDKRDDLAGREPHAQQRRADREHEMFGACRAHRERLVRRVQQRGGARGALDVDIARAVERPREVLARDEQLIDRAGEHRELVRGAIGIDAADRGAAIARACVIRRRTIGGETGQPREAGIRDVGYQAGVEVREPEHRAVVPDQVARGRDHAAHPGRWQRDAIDDRRLAARSRSHDVMEAGSTRICLGPVDRSVAASEPAAA